MTEINQKNKSIYLEVCKDVWDFDDESMEYIANRISDDWEPVDEFKSLLTLPNSSYEDQRVRIDMDMSNPSVLSFFKTSDKSYDLFVATFNYAINYLKKKYNCVIGYKEFIENKVVFKKNQTKIKKVFEMVYAESNDDFVNDNGHSYTKEYCSDWIVKKFEKIGASKKSAKKLQFVISFNPIDWLMSSTSEEWSSCFNINNSQGGYQYCLGLPFLCGDKNRMLLYITDGSKKECMGIEVDHYQTRTWCLLGKDGNFNIVKWYPNDTIGVSPVVSMTGDNRFKNRETFSKSKYPLDIISTKKGAVIGVYSDMGRLKEINNELWIVGNEKEGQQLFTKNLIDINASSYNSYRLAGVPTAPFNIHSLGYRIPEWKKLGFHIDMMFPSLKCGCCKEDSAGFNLNDERFLCYKCYKDKVFVCGSCKTQHYIEDGSYSVNTVNDETITICNKCYKDIEKRTCSCCGKYSTNLKNTIEKERICNNCLNIGAKNYSTCLICGKVSKTVELQYNTFTKAISTCCNFCKNDDSDNALRISTFGRYVTILKRRKAGGCVE